MEITGWLEKIFHSIIILPLLILIFGVIMLVLSRKKIKKLENELKDRQIK